MKKRDKRQRSISRSTESQERPPLMDRRAMEKSMREYARALEEREFDSIEEANAFLQQLLEAGGPPPRENLTPLEQAQDLMYQAFESSGKKRVQLARQALAVSEDCADAYVLLAEEEAESLEEARRLYEQGVKAGERALTAQMFEEAVGEFWSILETRPYMRARLGLAQCLWLLDVRQEAIAHLIDMLRLNPNDNQGVRWLLANYLLAEGMDEELGRLLKQYPEDSSAVLLYSRALWTFRQEGSSKKATARLKKALVGNPFVPSYLLGLEPLPRELPEYVGIGDEDEAAVYAAEGLEAWVETEGALEWLIEVLLAEVQRRSK